MDYALKTDKLCKNYPSFSLKDVDIKLPKGYIMGFIGRNGSGKTTTISSILGIIKTDSGKCYINGKEISDLTKDDKEKIGVVLDNCLFPGELTYEQTDKFMSKIYKNWESEKFLNLCQHFNFPKNTKLSKYSKGMKMKFSIATAICHKANILILDEATSGLDPIARDDILDILLDFVQDENNSVFMSSHITSDLEKICDYITFIDKGEIIFSEEKDLLKEKYGILHCSNSDFENLDKSNVISYLQNKFSTDALVIKNTIESNYVIDTPSIEDIMLYFSKGIKL